MKSLIYTLLATAGVLACAQDLRWQTDNQVQYLCGGVGDESMEALQAERSAANLSLLFAASERGAYVADVAVTISGNGMSTPVQFTAGGPICLLKMAAGKYKIAATWEGKEQVQNLVVGHNTRRAVFKWRNATAED